MTITETKQVIVMLIVFRLHVWKHESELCLSSLRRELSLSSAFDQFQPFLPNQPYLCLLIMCVDAQSLQSCLTFCDSWDRSLPGSSVHGILQARKLEWVAISFFEDLPNPGVKPVSLASTALTGRFFTTVPPGKPNV